MVNGAEFLLHRQGLLTSASSSLVSNVASRVLAPGTGPGTGIL